MAYRSALCLAVLASSTVLASTIVPSAAQAPDLLRDHQARFALVDKQAQALALVSLCDVELEFKPDGTAKAVSEDVRRVLRGSIASATERYRKKFDELAGPGACITALERFGPQGTEAQGLVVERKNPRGNFRGRTFEFSDRFD